MRRNRKLSGGSSTPEQKINGLRLLRQCVQALLEERGEKQAACCLILSDDGKVLAVSRKDDPTAFGLPGGKVDPGETPAEAAARELYEETGLVATNLRQVYVGREGDGYVTYTFSCNVQGQIDTSEAGLVRWVDPSALLSGPFADYNNRLWKRLGLNTDVDQHSKER